MTKYILPALLGFWCTLFTLTAQTDPCATVHFNQARHHTSSVDQRDAFEAWLSRVRTQSSLRNGEIITLPVIIHVIHNGEIVGEGDNLSEDQILSQIEVLNEDFRRAPGTPGFNEDEVGADVGLEFCPATIDPNGNPLPEPGIQRIDRTTISSAVPPLEINDIRSLFMPQLYWDPERYLNIYVVPGIKDGSVDNILGFASYPNSSTLSGIPGFFGPAQSDGVVVSADVFGRKGELRRGYNQGRTTTHEVGHWLGLIHIWGDANSCDIDDFCEDTPPADAFNTGCPTEVISCGGPKMLANYMDYTFDRCMNTFTQCQADRMRTVVEFADRRSALANSDVCGQIAPLPAFSANVQEICAGNPVFFSDRSRQEPTEWSWEFPGGTPNVATDSVVSVIYDQPGTYPVTLTVSNAQGSRTLTQTDFIRVIEPGQTVLLDEDFESGFDRWTIDNPDDNITWKLTQPAFSRDGRFAATINFFDYLAGGERDGLISPVYDLTYYQDLVLSFDYAYRPVNLGSRDSLQVWVSLDSGASYPYRVYPPADAGPLDFPTGEKLETAFDPEDEDDWCFGNVSANPCPSIDLSVFAGQPAFRLRFLAVCGSDNNLFLDNILLTASCEAEALPSQPIQQFLDFTLLPSPTTGAFKVRFSLNETSMIQIRGVDMTGREIYLREEESGFGPQERELDWRHVSPGLYAVEIRMDGQIVGRKLLVISRN